MYWLEPLKLYAALFVDVPVVVVAPTLVASLIWRMSFVGITH